MRHLDLENTKDGKMRGWDDKTDRGSARLGYSADRLEIVSLSGSSPESERVMGRSPGSGQVHNAFPLLQWLTVVRYTLHSCEDSSGISPDSLFSASAAPSTRT